MKRETIDTKLALFQEALSYSLCELGPWEVRPAEHVGPGKYDFCNDWQPMNSSVSWKALTTVFWRTRYEPQTAPAEHEARIRFDIHNFEGMASLDGVPYCGIDGNHGETMAPQRAGELMIEGLSVPYARAVQKALSQSGTFSGVSLVAVHRKAEQAWRHIKFAVDTVRIESDCRARELLKTATEEALFAVDPTGDRQTICSQMVAAGAQLQKRIGAIGKDPERGGVFLAGHSHIDTAWLWPASETVRKCARTFSTVCRLMDQYPDFHFSCSQPQLFAYTKQHYPKLFEEIRQKVKDGRWHTTGAMWVEPDINMPSGESLVRQCLHGLDFFKKEFGTRPRVCWLPDAFGFSAALPQILARCDIPYFYTWKMYWQSEDRFPLSTFRWEGLDGSQVLAHVPFTPGCYNGNPTPDELHKTWENCLQKGQHAEMLFPYGYGDGGGGPTSQMAETLARVDDYPLLPKCRTGDEEQFFDDIVAKGEVHDTWVGELYLEAHRGTYTTHGDVKKCNRRSEQLLRDAEILAAAAAWKATPVDDSSLDGAWKQTLTNQFHDILPGSSIALVYKDMERDARMAMDAAEQVATDAAASLTSIEDGQTISLFNTMSWSRTDPVAMAVDSGHEKLQVVAADGSSVPTQISQGKLIFEPNAIAPFSVASFKLATRTVDEEESCLKIEKDRIESPHHLIEFSADGSISRLFDKKAQREVVPDGALFNELQFFQDGPQHEDAWNIEPDYEKGRYANEDKAEIEVIESGPIRGGVRIVRRFRNSTVTQEIQVYNNCQRIDFVTTVDWQDRQVMLKAAFPLTVRSGRSVSETQFGAVERVTHSNTSWDREKFEVCAHRWVSLSEPGFGVSLLNDCKYGHDFTSERIRITLLRGPTWPDPQADLGEHQFVYSIITHKGDWVAGETVRRATELNAPMRVVDGRAAMETGQSWLTVDGMDVVVSALKRASDGDGWIVRVYEPHGARGQITVRPLIDLKSVTETNLVEEDEHDVAVEQNGFAAELSPFQVKTFRLR